MAAKLICPECRAALRVAGAVPKTVKCPKCGETFRPEAADEPAAKRRRADEPADDDFDFQEGERPVKAARRGRERDDDDDDRPRRKKKKAAAAKKAFPLWLPIAVGVAAVATLVVILVANSGKKGASKPDDDGDKNTNVVNGGPTAPMPKVGFPGAGKQDVFPPRKDRPNAPGDLVAVRGPDPKIEIPPLPPVDKRPVLVLDPGGHAARVWRVLFTKDGAQLITVSADKTIRLWDVGTGETVKTIHMPNGPGDEGSLTAAALAPDGKTLAVGGMPMGLGKHGILVYLVSLETGRIEKTFTGHRQPIAALAFNHDGRWLASGSYDGTAIITKVEDGSIGGHLKGHASVVRQVAFHPTDGRIATISEDKTARIWAFNAGNWQAKELAGHTAPGNCLAWRPDGKALATGSVDGTIRLWSDDGRPLQTATKEQLGERRGEKFEQNQIISLSFTRDGEELLYTGIALRGHAGLFNLKTGQKRVDFPSHNNSVLHGALSPDGTLAASTGGDDNETFIWKTADGALVQRIAGGGKGVWAAAWGEDGKTILRGNINRGSGVPPTRPLEHAFRLDALDHGKMPARSLNAQVNLEGYALSQPDFFRVTVTRGGQEHFTFSTAGTGDRIYSATLTANDQLVVGASFTLTLIDLKQKKAVRTFTGHAGLILAVAPSPDGRFFMTGSSDQTIRIWRFDREEPVLSLFFAGREWIAWTPEGYYAASANGERLMGWQVNNGFDKVGTFYPAAQFRASLFQPDVIKNLFRTGGELRDALALTIREHRRPIGAVNLTQVLPPAVEIVSPTAVAARAPLKEEQVEVRAAARSSGEHPVRALRLLVDGRPFGAPKLIADPKPGEVKADWKVALPPGKHTLHVLAASTVSQGLSAPVEITQQAGEKRPPNLFVLAVGVNDYPGRLKLNYAATDAQAISKVLCEKTKDVFGKVEVKMLLNKEATKVNVLQGLNWLEANMTARDIGISFFSGHGGKDEDDNFYLVPVDVGRDLAATGVPGEIVKKKLSEMPGRLVALLDACHSGSAAESLQVARADNLVRDLQADDCGVVVLCSSLGEECSLESTQTKAGFFTLGLVEGLTGKADFNKDGYVFIHEASLYAALRVKQLSGGEQNPTLGRSPNVRPFALTRP
jgi:WD40 repeat protein